MSAAADGVADGPPPGASGPAPSGRRLAWGLGLGAVLLLALGLRLWGIRSGLPYAYNVDENSHFVPQAINLFGHGLNPHYFVNPPLLTYLFHFVFAVGFGGGDGVKHALATDPTAVWVTARVTVALLGTLAVFLLYLAGTRLGVRRLGDPPNGRATRAGAAVPDRRVGLLAAGVLAVAFLPVFYAHLALNDAPTLAPVCLALWGVAGVLRTGRTRDYAIAGVGLGLAAATKYTGGIVLLPLLGAIGVQWRAHGLRGDVGRGILLAGGLAIAGFLVGNPFAVLDQAAFRDGLSHQSTASAGEFGKLGAPDESGTHYYLWTLTWGLGWVPALAALAGIVVVAVRDRALAVVLAPAPVLFLLFMGTQSRFFGRWMLPVYPLLCVLAALAAVAVVDALTRGRARPALASGLLLGLAAVLLCGQGLVSSVHSGRVLSREDTRASTRDWMVEHVPAGTKIVVEPVVPDGWAKDVGAPSTATANGNRWVKYPVFRTALKPDGTLGPSHVVGIEDYERTLRPQLVKAYEAGGYCYVVVGSTQRGRAMAQPREVPHAVSYYKKLAEEADVVYQSSPYGDPKNRVPFGFDWSFDYYPMAYARPGPQMTVYRLRGGRCASVS